MISDVTDEVEVMQVHLEKLKLTKLGYTRFRSGAERSLVNLAELLDEGSSIYIPYRQSRQSVSGIIERISLNSASALELEQLPGVGPSTAQKIIEGRPYRRVEDLLRVSGIGEITLERLRPLVRM